MAELIVESGPLRGRQVRLPPRGRVTIGRDPRCALVLEDQLVSRVHSIIFCLGDEWRIEDQDSLNHTLVDDLPIRRRDLEGGESIRIGETLFSFVVDEVDPLLGRELAGYAVEARLGRGAMGTVYRARQLSLDRPVALKILGASLSDDPVFIQRFLDEARAAGRLGHPNVVQVFDAGRANGHHFISMEYLEQGCLAEILEREGRLTWPHALRVGQDACRALAFAEDRRIVHRDIKPANLLVAADGTVKIGDLGIATDLRQTGSAGATGTIAGSPRYMAPEQARGEAIDHRADIYALGSTLYHALSGKPPFDGQSMREILQRKLNSDPMPLVKCVPDVPPVLSRVVAGMMARDPEARFQSANEALDALSAAARGAEPASTTKPKNGNGNGGGDSARKGSARNGAARKVKHAPSPARRRARRQSSAWAVVAGLAIVAVTIFLVMRDGTPRGGTESPPSTPPSQPAASSGDTSPTVVGTDAAATSGEVGAERTPGRREAERAARDAREAVKRAAIESAAAKARERVNAHLEAGELADAARALASLGQTAPEVVPLLASLRVRLDALVDEAIRATRTRVEELLAAGDFDGASAAVASLRTRLPRGPSRDAAITEIEGRVNDTRSRIAATRARLTTASDEVWRAIASLDFEAARQTVESVRDAHPEASAEIDALEERTRLLGKVWSRLRNDVEKLATSASATTVRLSQDDGLSAEVFAELPVSARLIGLVGSRVVVRESGNSASESELVELALLSLPTDTIFTLVGEDTASSKKFRRGLAELILLRRGPAAARRLLAPSDSDPSPPAAADSPSEEALLNAAGGYWFGGRLITLEELLAELTADPAADSIEIPAPTDGSTGAETWDFVAREAAELLAVVRADGSRSSARSRLRDIFVQARREKWRRTPPADLFHARRVTPKGTAIELDYDFQSPEELADFHRVDPDRVESSLSWNRSKKAMSLEGEVRFLQGNPFRGRIEIAGRLVAYDPSAPNVNVALWTAPDDLVSPEAARISTNDWARGRSRRRPRVGQEDDSFEIIVFGIGYSANLAEVIGRRTFLLYRTSFPTYLRETAFVVLGVQRGAQLHEDPTELIWDRPTGGPLRSASTFRVGMDGDELQWSVRGKAIPLREATNLDRLHAPDERLGSFNLFTAGSTVLFSSLTITGEIDPAWLDSHAETRAREELAALDGDVAAKEAPRRSTDRTRTPTDRRTPPGSPSRRSSANRRATD